MKRVHYELVERQETLTDTAVPSASGVAGGQTASAAASVGSSLLLGSTPTGSLLVTEPGITYTSTPSSDNTPSSSSSSSSNHSSSASVSTGSVVAIIVAVFLVLVGAMFVVHKYIKTRITSRARHPLSRGPPRGIENSRDYDNDKRRNYSDDRGEGRNRPPPGVLNITGVRDKSLDSGNFGLFEKEPSIRSVTDEKALTSDDHHFDPSTMATFAQYQADPAGELSRPRPLAAHEEGSSGVSWDGRTVISGQLLSLHGSASGGMSPTSVIARQTPQTTDSLQHRWESAEVVVMDGSTTEPSEASQNPFSDDSSVRRSTGGHDSDTRPGANPFFNASQHNPFTERSTRSRASSVSTAKRSRSYSISSRATVRAGESEHALFSLLAALDHTRVDSDEPTNRSSLQTTATSIYPPTESGVVPQAF